MTARFFSAVIAFAGLLILSGCTSVIVTPVPKEADFNHVYIIDNPSVIVPEFVQVMRSNFAAHGIKTTVIKDKSSLSNDLYFLSYTALRSWDFVTYLSFAEISIDKNGEQVGYAQYRLKGKGGLSLYKWQGVDTKMNPVLDELLIYYPKKKIHHRHQ